MSRDNSPSTVSIGSRGLGEATTVVLLIIVAVAAAGTISIAISGFTEGIGPSPGAELSVDKTGSTASFTVESVDEGVAYLEFRGDFDQPDTTDTSAGGFTEPTTSGDDVVVSAQNVDTGAGDTREYYRVDAAGAGEIEAGDVVNLENLEEGETITVVALDGDGNTNTVTTVTIEDTGTAAP
jgi:hypothetical protein